MKPIAPSILMLDVAWRSVLFLLMLLGHSVLLIKESRIHGVETTIKAYAFLAIFYVVGGIYILGIAVKARWALRMMGSKLFNPLTYAHYKG